MVKVCLRGRCKDIQLMPLNGHPVRCAIWVELDHNVSVAHALYDIQFLIPREFANLLEVGLPLTVTIEQNDH
jgi:hypothetical protein